MINLSSKSDDQNPRRCHGGYPNHFHYDDLDLSCSNHFHHDANPFLYGGNYGHMSSYLDNQHWKYRADDHGDGHDGDDVRYHDDGHLLMVLNHHYDGGDDAYACDHHDHGRDVYDHLDHDDGDDAGDRDQGKMNDGACDDDASKEHKSSVHSNHLHH